MPTLTAEQVAQINYQAGFRGSDLITATAIAKRESGYDPLAHRTSTSPKNVASGDRGLFQINYVNDPVLIKAGIITSPSDLFNPIINAKAAYYLYQRSNNTFSPWTAGPGGWTAGGDPNYGTNFNAARTAVSNAASQGLFGTDFKFDASWYQNVGTTGTGAASGGGPGQSAGGVGGDILSGVGDVLNRILDPLNIVPGNPISTVGQVLKVMGQLFIKLMDIQTWIRLLQIIGGGVLIIVGLTVMVGPDASTIASVAKVAAVA